MNACHDSIEENTKLMIKNNEKKIAELSDNEYKEFKI